MPLLIRNRHRAHVGWNREICWRAAVVVAEMLGVAWLGLGLVVVVVRVLLCPAWILHDLVLLLRVHVLLLHNRALLPCCIACFLGVATRCGRGW